MEKRIDTFTLVRMKAEAVWHASEGVPSEVIGRMVERSAKTVQGLAARLGTRRLGSVVTGHAENENAAKLAREQKADVADLVAVPPSQNGVPVAFWDLGCSGVG